MKLEDLILPGAIILGGYILLTKFKDIFKPLEDIIKPVTDIIPPIRNLDKPIIPSPPGFPKAPTPINYGLPATGVPGFVEFAKTPVGGKGSPTPSYGAFLFPPLGIVDAVASFPKLIEATFPKASKPKVVSPSLSLPVTPVQIAKGGAVFKVPVTQSLHGLINPKTGFRYSGR
jgi:hypothetical protein